MTPQNMRISATDQSQSMPTVECDFTGTARNPVRSFESPAALKRPEPFLRKLDYEGNCNQLVIADVHLG